MCVPVTVTEIPGQAVFHHKMNIDEMTWLEVKLQSTGSSPDMNSGWKDSISNKTFDINRAGHQTNPNRKALKEYSVQKYKMEYLPGPLFWNQTPRAIQVNLEAEVG